MTKLTLGYCIGSNACKRHQMIKTTALDGWFKPLAHVIYI